MQAPKPQEGKKGISEVDSVKLKAEQIADGADAEATLKVALESDLDMAGSFTAMKELLYDEVGFAADFDFVFSSCALLLVLSPDWAGCRCCT